MCSFLIMFMMTQGFVCQPVHSVHSCLIMLTITACQPIIVWVGQVEVRMLYVLFKVLIRCIVLAACFSFLIQNPYVLYPAHYAHNMVFGVL